MTHAIAVNVSVNCVIVRDGRFLLVQRGRPAEVKDRWSLPGGKVNEDENFTDAVVREAREETGLRVKGSQLSRRVSFSTQGGLLSMKSDQ